MTFSTATPACHERYTDFGFVGGTGASNGWSTAGPEGQIKYIASHALVGCVSGAMDGSGCGRGAASAAFGKLVMLNTQGDQGLQVAGTIFAGGVAAKIGGGKFATGAALAGFGYLFNYCASSGACTSTFEQAMYDWWPRYKFGTCINNGDCSGSHWTWASVDVALSVATGGATQELKVALAGMRNAYNKLFGGG